MRKVILDSQNKLIDIRTEYSGLQNSVDVEENTVKEIVNKINNDFFVYYDFVLNEFYYTKNIFIIKEELRTKRDKDLVTSDIFVMNDIWSRWTEEQKNVISIYRKDLREYINKIKVFEDIDLIEYPLKPDFLTL